MGVSIANNDERTITIGGTTYRYIPGNNQYLCETDQQFYEYDGTSMRKLNTPMTAYTHSGTGTTFDRTSNFIEGTQDDGVSTTIKDAASKFIFQKEGSTNNLENSTMVKKMLHQNGIYKSNEMSLHDRTYRFGYFDPDTLSTGREYLFFTRPDLNIIEIDSSNPNNMYLSAGVRGIPYFEELKNFKHNIIHDLELSVDDTDPFNHLLQNNVISNLDVPSLSSEMVETSTNDFGVGFAYRGSSEASDDRPTFSLEFKDNRWLEVYDFFKTYEKYQTIKKHGNIRPKDDYIRKKILHDQFAIFKFIVDEDMETIVYYGKMYGVVPKSLPREVFSSPQFDSGVTYTVDFEAAFYDDMEPEIIEDFNDLSKPYYDSLPYRIDVYNDVLDMVDTRPAMAAYVERVPNAYSPYGYVYKLFWKGKDVI